MIRDWVQADTDALSAIHEMTGFDYVMPDLDDPLFIVKKVVEEDGKPVQGVALKLTLTVYLWVDPEWGTPLMRWNRLKKIVAEAKTAAWEKGLDEIYAVIPPDIEKEFSPWLEKLGLSRDRQWPKWSIGLA